MPLLNDTFTTEYALELEVEYEYDPQDRDAIAVTSVRYNGADIAHVLSRQDMRLLNIEAYEHARDFANYANVHDDDDDYEESSLPY